MRRILSLAAVLVGLAARAGAPDRLQVDPDAGNSNFSAVFDAPLGERINAVSSRLTCELTYDSANGTASGSCSVPLTSIIVDSQPLKTQHFQQWATHQKSDPQTCALEVKFSGIKLDQPLAANKAARFTADVPFTVCGRARKDGRPEHVDGSAVLLASDVQDRPKTVRVRAQIEKFDREAYQIGPAFTEGWLAKVQSLSSIVAHEGRIELSLFATAKQP